MNLLMLSGDRSILQGKKGAFWYTLEEFHKYWDRIDIICPRAKGYTEETLHPFENVYFHPSKKSLWWQECWIRKIGRKLINEHHHDVMTVHDYPPFYNGAGGMYLGKKLGIPYVLEVHHIIGYPKPASLFEWIGKIQSRIYFPIAAKKATAIRTVNREVASVLERYGVPDKKIHVIPSFYLDHERLKPDLSVRKKYDVVCTGRHVANKGFAEIISAVALLPNVTLLIGGDGPLRSSFEKLAASLGIVDRVTFAGWSEESGDVYKALQSGRIFVMNSKSEGGPRVALEAMALGLPIITTEVGIMREVIGEGTSRAGYTTTGEPKDLAGNIKKLLALPSLQERLGYEAKKVLRRFERKDLIRRYAEFVKGLAET